MTKLHPNDTFESLAANLAEARDIARRANDEIQRWTEIRNEAHKLAKECRLRSFLLAARDLAESAEPWKPAYGDWVRITGGTLYVGEVGQVERVGTSSEGFDVSLPGHGGAWVYVANSNLEPFTIADAVKRAEDYAPPAGSPVRPAQR